MASLHSPPISSYKASIPWGSGTEASREATYVPTHLSRALIGPFQLSCGPKLKAKVEELNKAEAELKRLEQEKCFKFRAASGCFFL